METVEGFVFNDFCPKCQKLVEHKIGREGKELFGICGFCEQTRLMTDLNQVYYPKTKLWVTRFKIGNLPSVVTGKLVDSLKHGK